MEGTTEKDYGMCNVVIEYKPVSANCQHVLNNGWHLQWSMYGTEMANFRVWSKVPDRSTLIFGDPNSCVKQCTLCPQKRPPLFF